MFGILVLLLFAYSNEAQQGENHSLEALEKRVAKLEANVDLLAQAFLDLNSELNSKQHEECVFDLSNPQELTSFKRIDSPVGNFYISIEDIKPYLDGYKVRIKIGNPSLAAFVGFSMRVDWAGKIEPPPPSLTRSEVAKWLETAASTFQQKTFSFPHKLEPGTWTFVELVLTPAPKKLGRIGFSQLQTPTVELLQRKE